jgi:hypothetical protein
LFSAPSPAVYLDRDWPLIPVHPARKIPCVEHWPERATTNRERLRGWHRKYPGCLWGTPTGKRSGLVVLDIDIKHPPVSGWDTLEELGRSALPQTPIAHTRSGGVHYYFALNPTIEIRNSTGKQGLGPGLDIRGQGGFIVLPTAGSGYRWDPLVNLNTAALHPAPAWFAYRSKDRAPRYEGRHHSPEALLAESCQSIREAGSGSRHDVLNREAYSIAGLVSARALPEHEAWRALEAAMLTMVHRTGGDLRKAQHDLEDAFADGLRRGKR